MKALALALGLAMAAPIAMADDADRRGRNGIVKLANDLVKESHDLAKISRHTAHTARRPVVKKAYRQLAQKARKTAVKARQLKVVARQYNRGHVRGHALRVALRQLKRAKAETGAAFQSIPSRAKPRKVIQAARQFHRAYKKVENKVQATLPGRRGSRR